VSGAKIRIGILGAGAMGLEHAGSLLDVAGVEVAAVFSRDRSRAAATAKICEARPTTDAMEVIANPAIDAIDVCVPSVNHREFVTAASSTANTFSAKRLLLFRSMTDVR